MNIEDQPPISKIVWCLLIGIMCTNAAQFISMPFLALFLLKKEYSLWLSGLVIGAAPFSSMFGGFLGGQLSDVYGRIALLTTSIFATAFIFCAFYFACQIEEKTIQLAWLLIINFSFGLFSSFFQPTVMALLSDLLDPQNRERIYQYRYAAVNIGAVIGPLAGIYLGLTLSPNSFVYGGTVYLIYGVILHLLLTQNRGCIIQRQQRSISFHTSLSALLKDTRLLNFILFNLLFAISYSQINSTLAQFISQQLGDGPQIYAITIALNAMIVLIGQTPVYLFTQSIPKNKSIFYGCLIFALGFLGLAFSGNSPINYYFSIIIITLGELLIYPLASKFIDDIAPAHLRGTYFGALTFRELGLALGPFLGGLILQFIGGKFLFISMGILAIASYYYIVLCEQAKQRFTYNLMQI
jgi:MFS family permease